MEGLNKERRKDDMEVLHIKDGVTFALVDSHSELLRQAKVLRHDVYVACGFIEPIETRTIEDKKDDECHYLVALTEDGQVIGTIRLGGPPFKVLETLDHDHIEVYPDQKELIEDAISAKSYELGALAVRPRIKTERMHISGGLYKAAHLYGEKNGVDYWLLDVDKLVFESIKKLGWDIIQIAPEHPYMGSVTIPAAIKARGQLDHIKKVNPDYYDYMMS